MTPRSLTLASVLALSLLALAPVAHPALAQDAPIKIAVVDMDQVIARSAAGKALREKLEAHDKEARAEAETQQSAIRELRQKINDGANSLEQSELVELQKQLEDAVVKLRRFGDDKQREAQKIRSDGMADIQKQVDPVFKSIQEEAKYDLILNRQSGVVMMVGDRVNITQTVIDRLK